MFYASETDKQDEGDNTQPKQIKRPRSSVHLQYHNHEFQLNPSPPPNHIQRMIKECILASLAERLSSDEYRQALRESQDHQSLFEHATQGLD